MRQDARPKDKKTLPEHVGEETFGSKPTLDVSIATRVDHVAQARRMQIPATLAEKACFFSFSDVGDLCEDERPDMRKHCLDGVWWCGGGVALDHRLTPSLHFCYSN